MCSRAPSDFSIRPGDGSAKHSLYLPVCVPPPVRHMDPSITGESPLAGVDLGPNHTHDLLLHLRLLGVDVGISYLSILIHKKEASADMVRHWTHPDVAMFLQVLRCNHFTQSNAV